MSSLGVAVVALAQQRRGRGQGLCPATRFRSPSRRVGGEEVLLRPARRHHVDDQEDQRARRPRRRQDRSALRRRSCRRRSRRSGARTRGSGSGDVRAGARGGRRGCRRRRAGPRPRAARPRRCPRAAAPRARAAGRFLVGSTGWSGYPWGRRLQPRLQTGSGAEGRSARRHGASEWLAQAIQAVDAGRVASPSDGGCGMPDQCCVAKWGVVGYRGAQLRNQEQ